MIAWLKDKGKWLLGLLVAVGAILLGFNRYQTGRTLKEAQKAKQKADELKIDSAVEAEKQRQRLREAEANAAKVEELDKRLERLKRKHGMLPFILIGLLLLSLCGPVRAEEPTLPTDYAALAKLYFAALDRIAELKADLEEAISIADGYKQAYETEKRLREEAEAAVTRGLEREKQLQDVIEKQHQVILKLSGGKNLGVIVGGIVQPGDSPGTVRPGALLALQIEF
ncbi:MAG TPA: hypothetical protein GXX51_12330 [Firmicutes bacterium]|nr:hypothetical protein [Bacillota bacterium]